MMPKLKNDPDFHSENSYLRVSETQHFRGKSYWSDNKSVLTELMQTLIPWYKLIHLTKLIRQIKITKWGDITPKGLKGQRERVTTRTCIGKLHGKFHLTWAMTFMIFGRKTQLTCRWNNRERAVGINISTSFSNCDPLLINPHHTDKT